MEFVFNNFNDDEKSRFDSDMKNNLYQKWVDCYPTYIEDIFHIMYDYNGCPSVEVLTDFINRGLNPTSALTISSEYQDYILMDFLLTNNAIPNDRFITEIFYGYCGWSQKNTPQIVECLKVVEKHKLPLLLNKEFFDNLEHVDRKNEYINNFISRCEFY